MQCYLSHVTSNNTPWHLVKQWSNSQSLAHSDTLTGAMKSKLAKWTCKQSTDVMTPMPFWIFETDIKNDISPSVLNFLIRFSIRKTSGESGHFAVNNVLEFNDHHTSISLRSRGIKTQFYHASCATTNLTRIEWRFSRHPLGRFIRGFHGYGHCVLKCVAASFQSIILFWSRALLNGS